MMKEMKTLNFVLSIKWAKKHRVWARKGKGICQTSLQHQSEDRPPCSNPRGGIQTQILLKVISQRSASEYKAASFALQDRNHHIIGSGSEVISQRR